MSELLSSCAKCALPCTSCHLMQLIKVPSLMLRSAIEETKDESTSRDNSRKNTGSLIPVLLSNQPPRQTFNPNTSTPQQNKGPQLESMIRGPPPADESSDHLNSMLMMETLPQSQVDATSESLSSM